MQFLKSLVIVMGVVIVVGMGLLGYSLYRKATEPAWNPFAAGGDRPPQWPAFKSEPFGSLELALPEGCVIGGIRPTRGPKAYVIVRPEGTQRGVAQGGPCNRIIVVDVHRGRVLGTIKAQDTGKDAPAEAKPQ